MCPDFLFPCLLCFASELTFTSIFVVLCFTDLCCSTLTINRRFVVCVYFTTTSLLKSCHIPVSIV